jgi:hypothetical protein
MTNEESVPNELSNLSPGLSWNKTPHLGLRPDIYYYQTVAGLLIWDALSDERTGLLFTISAGLRQHSHSRVRVFWDSRSYFTVSDSRLPFSSPPTTRRVTVEVFYPVSKRETLESSQSQSQSHIATNGQSVSQSVRYLLLFDSYGLVFEGRPL